MLTLAMPRWLMLFILCCYNGTSAPFLPSASVLPIRSYCDVHAKTITSRTCFMVEKYTMSMNVADGELYWKQTITFPQEIRGTEEKR